MGQLKPVTYYESEIPVLVGDYVEFKIGLLFWKGWQPGRVYYVPGISPPNSDLESDDLSWVSIHDSRNAQVGIVVDPTMRCLRRTVRFIRRTDDELTDTPAGYSLRE